MVRASDARLEREYQAELIRKLKRRFPNCYVLKNDSSYMQGVPDLLILFENKWAMLEVKPHKTANEQPNQKFYVHVFDVMSFGAFIYPENEEVVLNDLESAFRAPGPTRPIKRKQISLD